MTDKFNLDYDALVALQEKDLAIWRKRLMPFYHVPITEYVRAQNRMAPTANDKHLVFRGQDLVEIIRVWPKVEEAGFPALPKPGEEFI